MLREAKEKDKWDEYERKKYEQNWRDYWLEAKKISKQTLIDNLSRSNQFFADE